MTQKPYPWSGWAIVERYRVRRGQVRGEDKDKLEGRSGGGGVEGDGGLF